MNHALINMYYVCRLEHELHTCTTFTQHIVCIYHIVGNFHQGKIFAYFTTKLGWQKINQQKFCMFKLNLLHTIHYSRVYTSTLSSAQLVLACLHYMSWARLVNWSGLAQHKRARSAWKQFPCWVCTHPVLKQLHDKLMLCKRYGTRQQRPRTKWRRARIRHFDAFRNNNVAKLSFSFASCCFHDPKASYLHRRFGRSRAPQQPHFYVHFQWIAYTHQETIYVEGRTHSHSTIVWVLGYSYNISVLQ